LDKDYYIIKQELPTISPVVLKIFAPVNIKHLRDFISLLVGQINVYYYTIKDNSRKDLTNEFIHEQFDINDIKLELVGKRKLSYINHIHKYINFVFYIYEGKKNIELKQFFMNGENHSLKSISACTENVFKSNISDKKRNDRYGNNYEKFIANKYIELGYEVILNGINKNVNDGGIDLIAKKENSIILVQCKNWSMSNEYKINQKDLRAFLGDGFIYMKENGLLNTKVSFHFIVSHDNILNEGALKFLSEQNILKFKYVPFEY
jgi:restriction system protein